MKFLKIVAYLICLISPILNSQNRNVNLKLIVKDWPTEELDVQIDLYVNGEKVDQKKSDRKDVFFTNVKAGAEDKISLNIEVFKPTGWCAEQKLIEYTKGNGSQVVKLRKKSNLYDAIRSKIDSKKKLDKNSEIILLCDKIIENEYCDTQGQIFFTFKSKAGALLNLKDYDNSFRLYTKIATLVDLKSIINGKKDYVHEMLDVLLKSVNYTSFVRPSTEFSSTIVKGNDPLVNMNNWKQFTSIHDLVYETEIENKYIVNDSLLVSIIKNEYETICKNDPKCKL